MASSNSYYASLQLWAGDKAPRGWALCFGQLMSVSSNKALFSLIGTMYGGDGRHVLALPDMRGRTPICPNTKTKEYYTGQRGGSYTTRLNTGHLPSHTHQASFTPASAGNLNASVSFPVNTDGTGGVNTPADNYFGNSGDTDLYYSDYTKGSEMAEVTVTIDDNRYEYEHVSVDNTGNSATFSLMQPYLVMNFIICTDGVYPPRNAN